MIVQILFYHYVGVSNMYTHAKLQLSPTIITHFSFISRRRKAVTREPRAVLAPTGALTERETGRDSFECACGDA